MLIKPSLQTRFNAASIELAMSLDGRHSDMRIILDDGTTMVFECENETLSGFLRKIPKIARSGGQINAAAADVAAVRTEEQRENTENRRTFEDMFDNSDAAIIDYDLSSLFRIVQQLKHDGVCHLRTYLAESEERLNNLVDAVRINNANAAALRLLGAASLHELGKQSNNIVDIAEAMLQGEERIRGSEYLVAGGASIPVVYSQRIPRTEEEARRVPIVIMDLSDIRLAEAARQATIAKSQFLSSMSHEIRTPLNGVIGNLELLALTTLDSEQFELIDDADKAAKALLGLVGNILDFSKIEAGKLTVEMGDINPAALVEEAIHVLQSLARQKKIFVTATFGSDVPSLVRGDAMRLRQVLLNLIGNAVKFTEHGGVYVNLTVSAWDREVCELRWEVHDSGRGFGPIRKARLFEPFIQIRTDNSAEEGTGLGLSICKSLVEAFGGAIGCDAVHGEGATFWFTLPMAVLRRAPPMARPDLSNSRVMIIGPNNGAAKLLQEYFKTRGAAVVTQAHQANLAFALVQGTSEASIIDVAVLVPDGADNDDSDAARQLRDEDIVPILYGAGQSPRKRLRQGFAAVIPPGADADYLDRNASLWVGHSKARDWISAQQAAVVSAISNDLRGKRVLVLEDRLVNQTVIQKQLDKLGIECTLATNGVEALEILEGQRFDLILCDCSMPVMNGYDFTRELRKRALTEENGRRLPVIALTANAFREDADKCFEAGMDDFISKPVTMDRLSAMLVRWLSPAESAQAALETDDVAIKLPVDLARLAEILGTNELETLNLVLADFLAVAGSSLSDVEAAVSSSDCGRMNSAAHNAKGEALCAAATGLAELYAELEGSAKNGDRTASQELAARAGAEVHRVGDFIREHLATRSS